MAKKKEVIKEEKKIPNICFEIRNKQYLCSVGDNIISCFLDNTEIGSELTFDKVLMWDEKVGTPYLENLEVKCKVVKHLKAKKLHIIHLISQKRHRKRMGFRAKNTLLQVSSINKK
ncbi:50S ribosomal protein L21 [Mycoplasma suis]|uniref:50S ribosomal protein L21 n=2 Tax=Mycoplasma suis TaxID=57372 RepID=F0QR28_MYCSL|nr:50S ribosomal protein L21 [Mycoplasma suis]ADX97948.1 50S ribosomal protein L21 [Mycoplasma suis str. Illinois]CBZ40444.1 50S ribosomal protein L21 [Mycoplasma suis KI3806]